jgi:hypothetical protein
MFGFGVRVKSGLRVGDYFIQYLRYRLSSNRVYAGLCHSYTDCLYAGLCHSYTDWLAACDTDGDRYYTDPISTA